MGFSNKTIKPIRSNKPHICVRDGWWRVSPCVKPYFRECAFAHAYAAFQNNKIRRDICELKHMTPHDAAEKFVNDNLVALCQEVINLKNGARTGPLLIHLQGIVPRVGSPLLLACAYVGDEAMAEVIRRNK